MAKAMNELTAKVVKDAQPRDMPYRMVDGGGLFCWSTPAAASCGGSSTEAPYSPSARIRRSPWRNPAPVAKAPCTSTPEAPKDTSPTFRVAAAEWHHAQTNWSDTNQRIVLRLLEDCVFPHIGDLRMAQITKTIVFNLVVKPF